MAIRDREHSMRVRRHDLIVGQDYAKDLECDSPVTARRSSRHERKMAARAERPVKAGSERDAPDRPGVLTNAARLIENHPKLTKAALVGLAAGALATGWIHNQNKSRVTGDAARAGALATINTSKEEMVVLHAGTKLRATPKAIDPDQEGNGPSNVLKVVEEGTEIDVPQPMSNKDRHGWVALTIEDKERARDDDSYNDRLHHTYWVHLSELERRGDAEVYPLATDGKGHVFTHNIAIGPEGQALELPKAGSVDYVNYYATDRGEPVEMAVGTPENLAAGAAQIMPEGTFTGPQLADKQP
jgi:hypothetical protein